jgi:N-acyl-D-amino-acid deacylase
MDILIKNGAIIDGTGSAPHSGNIAIKNGKIAAIGPVIGDTAEITIDAGGLIVCPGFIDITNHSDTHWTLFNYPSQASMLMQGITTIAGGSCGASLAPLRSGEISAQSVQKWVDTSEINVNWLSMEEFLTELERHKLGINFCSLAGHGTLRRNIMGDAVRPANTDEIQRMAFLLDTALAQGAFGLSLGLTFSHGRPATDEELIELANIVRARNRLLTVHLRDEGKDLLPAITEVLRIARQSGVRTHITHFKSLGRESWEHLSRGLQFIRSGRDEGLDITMSTFPYTQTGSLLYALLPPATRDGGKDAILQRITDPKQRRIEVENLRSYTLHYEKITIANAKETPHMAGSTIAGLAKNWEMPPEEAMLEILAVNDLSVTIFSETINEKHIAAIYLEPYAFFATDGIGYEVPKAEQENQNLIHPRSFGASAQFLGNFVREQALFSWEHAVEKMTRAPAEVLNLSDRGVIKKGNRADITLINQAAIADTATYSDPFHYPAGIPWVIINGTIAVENGKLATARAGSIVRAS